MKLLLKKDISHLGIVGDVINVTNGYGRNYLLPQGLATEATASNMRALAEERKLAEERRRQRVAELTRRAERLKDVEVTIAAAANDEGVLYGSVGAREVAAALREEGHDVDASCIELREPIRRLDNVTVDVRFASDIHADVKVWVVRSQAPAKDDGDEGDEDADERRDDAYDEDDDR
jgi:large subunit ribosomal protein L9